MGHQRKPAQPLNLKPITEQTMSKTYKITGNDAVRLAQRENLTVGDNDGTPFVTVTPTGWRDSKGNHCDGEGRTVEAYFNSYTGEYFGPDDDGVEPCWNDASLSDDGIKAYLSTLSADARADWAAGKLDEVMTDHATGHFGIQINTEITRVAAASTYPSQREFAYATDSASGTVEAASLADAYQTMRARISDAQVSDGATLWVEDPGTCERMTMSQTGEIL